MINYYSLSQRPPVWARSCRLRRFPTALRTILTYNTINKAVLTINIMIVIPYFRDPLSGRGLVDSAASQQLYEQYLQQRQQQELSLSLPSILQGPVKRAGPIPGNIII